MPRPLPRTARYTGGSSNGRIIRLHITRWQLQSAAWSGPTFHMTRAAQIWDASRLADLPDRYRAVLLPLSAERTYERGEIVGLNSPQFSLVISGQVCGYMLGHSGRRVAFHYYGSGDVMGLLSVIRPNVTRAPVRMEHSAVRDSQVLEFPKARLREMVIRDPEAFQLFSQLFARDMLEDHSVLTDYIFSSVRQLLTRHLLKRATYVGGQVVVKATQEELASAIGSVRAVVARTLSELRAEGLVDRGKQGLIIPDTAALCRDAKRRLGEERGQQ